MKTLIGIDEEGKYKAAMDLCMALDFSDQHILLAHAIQPPTFLVPIFAPTDIVMSSLQSGLEAQGDRLVEKARSHIDLAMPCETAVVVGTPVEHLLGLAVEKKVDLFALGAGHRSGASYYFGSVCRGIAVGAEQSFLVAKGKVKTNKKLSAIFATDHSEYSNKCLEKFCSWAPKGIDTIHVVTAYDPGGAALDLLKSKIEIDIDLEKVIRTEVEALCANSVARLESAGYNADYLVYEGHPNDALHEAMETCDADLLILGARGHGFVEQVLIGSISLHQISRESYSVLVMRV